MVDKRIAIFKDVVLHPKAAFRELGSNGSYYFPTAVIVIVVASIVSSLLQVGVNTQWTTITDYEKSLSHRFFLAFASIAAAFLITGLVLYIGRFLKGKANYKGLFSSLQYAGIIPSIVTSAIFLYVSIIFFPSENFESPPLLIQFISVAASSPVLIWGFILGIFACREAHGFSTGRSFATYLIVIVIFAIAGVVIFFFLINTLGLPTLLGTMTQASHDNKALTSENLIIGTYFDPQTGIEFTVPDGWMGKKASADGNFIFLGKFNGMSVSNNSSIFITNSYKSVTKNNPMDMFAWSNSTNTKCVGSVVPVTVDGMNGVRAVEGCTGEFSGIGDSYYFKTDKSVVMIMYTTKTMTDSINDLLDFHKFLDSFKILNAIHGNWSCDGHYCYPT